jgi:hypothetical protein
MNEDALRALIRQAVARQLAPDPASSASVDRIEAPPMAHHVSHYRYTLPDSGGACLIEPTVPCNHCGYCQSHGH